MQSTLLNQVVRSASTIIQTLFLIFFVGVAYMSMGSMTAEPIAQQALGDPGVPLKLGQEDACGRRTWLVLPIVFLCGGVVNLDGFASTAALLM
mmetsp:Transcript_123775/g.358026  ORF Transcript_123775/g.358026 Transcript_123775/m.358026 type:complete len:93 (-) Transcript_123775:192-470(-)